MSRLTAIAAKELQGVIFEGISFREVIKCLLVTDNTIEEQINQIKAANTQNKSSRTFI